MPGLGSAPRASWGPTDGGRVYRGSGLEGQPVDRNHGAAQRVPPPRRPETSRERLTSVGWAAAWEAVRALPPRGALVVGSVLAAVVRRTADLEQFRANLSRVTSDPDLDAAVESLTRHYVEAFKADRIDPAWLDARTTTEGFQHLDSVLEEGRGAIALLAHHGSWDMAAAWAESHGYHLACVAEVLRPRGLFKRYVRMREALGLEIVPLARGGDVSDRLAEVLAANHVVGLLADRDLSGRGPVVELFGEPARLPPGAAKLNRRTGAPILPVSMLHRPGGRYHIEVLPSFHADADDLTAGVQRVARGLEELIRLAPEQWHVLQPVFEADR